jgi:hypothetical protein
MRARIDRRIVMDAIGFTIAISMIALSVWLSLR